MSLLCDEREKRSDNDGNSSRIAKDRDPEADEGSDDEQQGWSIDTDCIIFPSTFQVNGGLNTVVTRTVGGDTFT